MSNDDSRSVPEGSNPFWGDTTDSDVPQLPPDTELTIDNVAKMFGVSRFTLRYYEARGLIKRRHRIGTVRVYGWADCDRIAFIIKSRRAGLKLSEIVPLIEIADDVLGDREFARQTCLELIDRLVRRRSVLDEELAELWQLYTILGGKPIKGDRKNDRS